VLDRNHFIWAGRFCYSKNILSLIKAWKEFISENTNINQELHLYGGEFQNQTIKKTIYELIEKESSIKLFSSFSPNNINIFCQYRFLLLPSFREGCPNVLVESFSAGLPVIGSNIPGISEHIKAVNGVLIEKPLIIDSIKFSLQQAILISKEAYSIQQEKIDTYFEKNFSKEYISDLIDTLL